MSLESPWQLVLGLQEVNLCHLQLDSCIWPGILWQEHEQGNPKEREKCDNTHWYAEQHTVVKEYTANVVKEYLFSDSDDIQHSGVAKL